MTSNDDAAVSGTGRAQRRFPIAVSDLEVLKDEARYLAQQTPADGSVAANFEAMDALDTAISQHLTAAKEQLCRSRFRLMPATTFIGSVMAHVHAAETLMLRRGSADYLMGMLPKIQSDVRNHLKNTDPQRIAFEQLIRDMDLQGSDAVARQKFITSNHVREEVINASMAATMAYRREYARLLSFHRGLIAWTAIVLLLAVGFGFWGLFRPTDLAICFTPQGQELVVCPTREHPYTPADDDNAAVQAAGRAQTPSATDRASVIADTVQETDVFLILLAGMAGAAVTAAGAFRKVVGTATPYNLPVAMALLKLPLGAITALFGLLLIRGGFFPGLSDLDSAPQILAWAVIFGAAQQLFTVLVDQQARRVQDQVGELPAEAGK